MKGKIKQILENINKVIVLKLKEIQTNIDTSILHGNQRYVDAFEDGCKFAQEEVTLPVPEHVNKSGFTQEEEKCHKKLMECYNIFQQLERQHPDEMRDFVDGIHRLQSVLAMRIVRRSYPQGWPMKK